MLRLRVAAAALVVVAAACGGTAPDELRTIAAEDQPAVVQSDWPRPVPSPPTTTTTLPPSPPTTQPPPPPVTTTPPTTSPPPPEPTSSGCGGGYGDPADEACWDRLAACESGGDWTIDTGNGYYGGLQFALSSWRGVGGTGYPHEHPRSVQIEMGRRLHAQGGWAHWPACTRRFGWR